MKQYVLVTDKIENGDISTPFSSDKYEIYPLDTEKDFTNNLSNIVDMIYDTYRLMLQTDRDLIHSDYCLIQNNNSEKGIFPITGNFFNAGRLYKNFADEDKEKTCEYVVYFTSFSGYFAEWPNNVSEYTYPECLEDYKTRMLTDNNHVYVGICIIGKDELKELVDSNFNVYLKAIDVNIQGKFDKIGFEIEVPDESIIRKLPHHITKLINSDWVRGIIRR